MIEGLNKAFENRLRLGIMGLLMVKSKITFNELKEELGATDGNLSSHVNSLERLTYLNIDKRFVGKKPQTTYTISKQGRVAFNKHLAALEILLNNMK